MTHDSVSFTLRELINVDAQIVGERIAKLRKSHNMTQKQMADELSVTNKAVSKWETGAGLPDIAMLPALASVLNVSIDEIVSGSSNDDYKIDDNNKRGSRFKNVRRYVRKPVVIITSSLIITLAAFVIIYSSLKPNEGLEFDENIQVHLDEASGFGVTSSHANEIYAMQLGDDLRRQLLQFNYIDDAVVLLTIVDNSPFRIQENGEESKVSVFLTMAGAYTLSDSDLQTIKTLIMGSMPPGLKDENISIT